MDSCQDRNMASYAVCHSDQQSHQIMHYPLITVECKWEVIGSGDCSLIIKTILPACLVLDEVAPVCGVMEINLEQSSVQVSTNGTQTVLWLTGRFLKNA